MNYTEFLKQKTIEGVYVLKGDAFLCRNAKNYIIKTLDIADINVFDYDDENFDANGIVNSCNQFSFFNEKRLVCVNYTAKDLTSTEKTSLQNYIDNYNENCVLVFLDDSSSKVFDVLKNVNVVECKMSQEYIVEHILTEFKAKGKNIEPSTCKMLVEYCLSDITRINQEIKKICDYMANKTEVTQDIIDYLVVKETELQVFALTDALGAKNKTKALKILNDMLNAGEAPIKILALISGQFRRMMFAKINKGSSADLAKALGCKEYAVTKAKQQANGFSAGALKRIINLLLDADYNIKSGQMSQENSLYFLVLAIINQK